MRVTCNADRQHFLWSTERSACGPGAMNVPISYRMRGTLIRANGRLVQRQGLQP
jgi:hypothetical protein